MEDILFVASKVFWGLVQPSNMIALLSIVVPVLVLAKVGRRVLRFLSATLLVLVVALAVLPVGNWLLAPLEHRFPAAVPDSTDKLAGIIVLGGVIDPVKSAKSGMPAIGSGAERITEMLYLANRFPDVPVIFSGGSGRLSDTDYKEGDAARRLVERIGLDPSRFDFESEARNTVENAIYVGKIHPPEPGKVWLLVTSAFHMPRSVGVFRRVGFNVAAYPVDIGTVKGAGFSLGFDLIGGVARATTAIKEWIGLFVYRVLGRTDSWFPAP
jgi:uncharacterized SAM-binding protein YcdF (DUF218 family)